MMYSYISFPDGTEVTHSELKHYDDVQTIDVHFEKPIDGGFCSARCTLPDYSWKFNEGYSKQDTDFFEEFLRNNAHLLFRYAAQGGIECA